MPNADEIISELSEDEATYNPALDFEGLIPVGDYFAHISGLEIKTNVRVRNKFLADLYIPKVRLADENRDNTYHDADGEEIEGKALVGRDVASRAYFRFKKPDPEKYPDLSDTPGSNKRYMELLQVLGVELVANEEEIVKLPPITEDLIIGKPVIVSISHDSWTNKNGEQRYTPKVYSIIPWQAGKHKDDSLPF